jgi:hypothetical protein
MYQLHFILGGSSIHKTQLIRCWHMREPRVHLHFTLTSGSWLDLVECWFALFTARELESIEQGKGHGNQ